MNAGRHAHGTDRGTIRGNEAFRGGKVLTSSVWLLILESSSS